MNYFEIIVTSLFYQFALYIAIRLAHRGFTLGELGIVCFGGTALCLELINITIARVRRFVLAKEFANCVVDMASHYTIYQNISSSDAAPHLPTRFDPWIIPHGVSPFPLSRFISPHLSSSRSPAEVPPGKTTPSSILGSGVLHRSYIDRRGVDRYVDKMVPRFKRSVALGPFLDSRRKKKMEPACVVGILGFTG